MDIKPYDKTIRDLLNSKRQFVSLTLVSVAILLMTSNICSFVKAVSARDFSIAIFIFNSLFHARLLQSFSIF